MEDKEQQVDDGMMQYAYPPAYMPKNDKADLMDKINPDAIVEVIRHKLMGEEYINGSWVRLPQLKNKAISFSGAWDLSNLMLSVSNRNVSISKLKDNEIRARSLNIAKTAVSMMLRNWKEYGINGSDQIRFIYQMVFSTAFITLKQPEGEGIRKMIMGTTSESVVHTDQQKEGGLLSRIWGRR